MHNAKAFLEDAVFVPSQEAVASGNKVLDDAIAITHRRQIGSKSNQPGAQGTALGQRSAGDPERATRYWIVDSVGALSKFGSSDVWDRVVCVMTTGQEWQFRPYKWSEPKELFHHGANGVQWAFIYVMSLTRMA